MAEFAFGDVFSEPSETTVELERTVPATGADSGSG